MPTVAELKISQRELLNVVHQELDSLPPLPTIIMQTMQMVNDPKVCAADLNKLISTDQAMSAKVLRLVNSAYYGFPSKVTTIMQAIVILGFDTIRNLVAALGVANQFVSGAGHVLDRQDFWAHSVATAVAAQTIARHRRQNDKVCEEVFVGGLLHDLGKLFLDQHFTTEFNIAIRLARAGKIGMLRAENTTLGIDHALVGKRIGSGWRLPAASTAMIAMHHDPEHADAPFEYAACVHAADIVAKELALGNSGDFIVPELDPQTERWLAFTPDHWKAVHEDTVEKFNKTKEFIGVLSD